MQVVVALRLQSVPVCAACCVRRPCGLLRCVLQSDMWLYRPMSHSYETLRVNAPPGSKPCASCPYIKGYVQRCRSAGPKPCASYPYIKGYVRRCRSAGPKPCASCPYIKGYVRRCRAAGPNNPMTSPDLRTRRRSAVCAYR